MRAPAPPGDPGHRPRSLLWSPDDSAEAQGSPPGFSTSLPTPFATRPRIHRSPTPQSHQECQSYRSDSVDSLASSESASFRPEQHRPPAADDVGQFVPIPGRGGRGGSPDESSDEESPKLMSPHRTGSPAGAVRKALLNRWEFCPAPMPERPCLGDCPGAPRKGVFGPSLNSEIGGLPKLRTVCNPPHGPRGIGVVVVEPWIHLASLWIHLAPKCAVRLRNRRCLDRFPLGALGG